MMSVQLMMRLAAELDWQLAWSCQAWRLCCAGHAQPWTCTLSPLQGCQLSRSKRCCHCRSAYKRISRCGALLQSRAHAFCVRVAQQIWHPGLFEVTAAGCHEHVQVLSNVSFGVEHAHLLDAI